MSDQELVNLIRETAPEELSPEALAEIRERLPHSVPVRHALHEQLAVEERLSSALGRIEVNSARLWSRVAAADMSHRRRNSLYAWIACAGIAAALLVVIVSIPRDENALTVGPPAPTEASAVGGQGSASGSATADLPSENQAAIAEIQPESPPTADPPTSTLPDASSVPPPTAAALWPELNPQAERLPLSVTAFRETANATSGISQSQLTRWLSPAAGQPANFFEGTRGETPVAGFEGLVRLAAPWPADAVLRLAPFEHNTLALHFWNGLTGISLYYYESPRPIWAAHRTTRTADQPRPATFVLIGADDDRYDRSLRGVVEIRHQEGQLVLSRGDLRLMTVPFSGPPTDVYFDRRAWFRTLTMFRGEPLPEKHPESGTNLLPEVPLTQLEWTSTLSGGTSLTRDPDGTMRLAREKDAGPAWAGVKLPRTGLCEAILQLDGADPGTGIYLADSNGIPLHVLGLVKDQRTGGAVLGWMRPDAGGFETQVDVANQPVAYAGADQWIRIISGGGAIKCWVSGDGIHWGRALDPQRGTRDDFSQLGLIAFRAVFPGQIGLKRFQLRELTEVTSLAEGNLLDRVPPELLNAETGYAAWYANVLAHQPEGVAAAGWRVACGVRILSQGRPAGLGNRILAGLLDDCLDRDVPLHEHLRVLDQAALSFDAWDPPEADRFLLLYDRAARQAAERGQTQAFSLTSPSFLAGPLWTAAKFQVCPEPLVRAEMMSLVYDNRWHDVLDLCGRLQFWNRPSQPEHSWPDHRQRTKRLTEWAEAQSRSILGDREAAPANAPQTIIRWQHPLVAPSSKDGWSVLADLQNALAESQFAEAGQIIGSIQPDQLSGLSPDEGEPGLYESLTQFVGEALKRHPAWRQTMIERFGMLGGLRVQQAIERGTIREMQTVAVQFSGTPAAIKAYRWLGDRALVEGNFLGAMAEYQRGRLTSLAEAGGGFSGREKIAAAFLGRDPFPSVTSAVPAIEPPLSTADYDALLADLRKGATVFETGAASRGRRRRGKVDPVVWRALQHGEWQGQTGTPNGDPPDSNDIDWAARQMAFGLAGDRLFASNRLQMICFNLATGQREWLQVFPDTGQFVQRWPLLSLQSVVVNDRIFLRRPRNDHLAAFCLEAATGKELWATDPSLYVASDPLLIQGLLYCFTTNSPPLDQTWQMDLTALDPETGEVIRQTSIAQLNSLTDRFLSAQVTMSGTRLVAAIGGAVVCCDFSGRLLWLRRQTWVPAVVDAALGERDYTRPLVLGQRVLIAQPGVLDLACLDLETGRQLWHAPWSEGRRILGGDDRQVYVETSRSISAMALDDGRVAWTHPVAQILDANWSDGEGMLLYSRVETMAPDKARPLLVWLDTNTGRALSVWPLAELEDRQPQLGPLIRRGDQMWTFFGRGLRGGPRGLFQLTSVREPAFPAHDEREGVDRWSLAVSDARTRLLAERFLPEWSQFGGVADGNVGFRPEFQGQHEVLATLAAPDRPLVYTREVTLPTGSRARLLLRVGHDSPDKWQLRVRAAGRVLLTESIDATTVEKNWGRFEVDLSEFAGQTIRIVVEQMPTDRPMWAYWKQLEIVL
ncbi:MAG: hypothetical protein EXS05_11650 [Planctomycetaceae bacterium]|nr:hypothetical protein [Planctomycetaceae bacterium]